MAKGISSINGFLKTGIVAAMLAGSTALYASNPIKKDAQTNQTEVVSKEGAEAMKAVSGIAQTSVPKVHNQKLDAALRKYIETEDDKKYIENIINNAYKNNGTYLGSAIIQHEIDLQHFCSFVFQNTDISIKNNINPQLGKQIKSFGPEFFLSLDCTDNLLNQWIKDYFNKTFIQKFTFDRVPDVMSVHDKITDFVSNAGAVLLDMDGKIQFMDDVLEYTSKKNEWSSTQAKSDLIAREIFIMDKLMFNRILTLLSVFDSSTFKNGNKTIKDYFNQWMDSVKPDKNY